MRLVGVKMFKKMSFFTKVVIAILMLAPVILGYYWYTYLDSSESSVLGAFLSPVNNTPIMISLIVFLVGYLIFIIAMFYDNIKEFMDKRTHKS
tara:strand:+ start:491 stop:769 length:279 start_codon:yes stop_codon:yes gene_type:complete